jgi:esterase/lipase superfamily enzyme
VQIAYHKGFSHHLGRDMEYKRFGHAGRPVVMFPTSRGRFFQYEDTGTIAALADFIEAGRIQVWTLDGIDDESFFGKDPDMQQRIGRHEAYFRYSRDEAFPELTAGVIALSGVYSTRDFFGAALDGGIYFNSPLDYLAGLTDERILERLRSLRLFFCCGQGAWEGRMLVETRELEAILRGKGIPAWVDYWGKDVSHDWPWWHRQLVYFMSDWLDEDAKRQVA